MNKLYISLLLIVTLVGCTTTKNIGTTKLKKVDAELLIEKVKAQQHNFEWFSGKAKMNFDDGKKKKNFTAQIRMRRDSICWVSITSLMGIEAARILITNDTIHILDKLGKKYYKKPVRYIDKFVPFSFDMKVLQDVLIGNSGFVTGGKAKSKVEGQNHLLIIDKTDLLSNLWLTVDFRINKLKLIDKKDKRTVVVDYKGYDSAEEKPFPYERSFIFTGEQEASAELKFTKVKWNVPVSFPFHVSSKYEIQD